MANQFSHSIIVAISYIFLGAAQLVAQEWLGVDSKPSEGLIFQIEARSGNGKIKGDSPLAFSIVTSCEKEIRILLPETKYFVDFNVRGKSGPVKKTPVGKKAGANKSELVSYDLSFVQKRANDRPALYIAFPQNGPHQKLFFMVDDREVSIMDLFSGLKPGEYTLMCDVQVFKEGGRGTYSIVRFSTLEVPFIVNK